MDDQDVANRVEDDHVDIGKDYHADRAVVVDDDTTVASDSLYAALL